MKAHGSDRIAKYCRVLLDGVDVTADCEFADEEHGRVVHFRRGEDGQYFTEQSSDGGRSIATSERRGRVRILVPWWRRIVVAITPSWRLVRLGRRLIFLPWWTRITLAPIWERRGCQGWFRFGEHGPGFTWRPASDPLLFGERHGFRRWIVVFGRRVTFLPRWRKPL